MMDLSDTGIRHRVNLILHRFKYGAKPLVLADEIAALARSIRDQERFEERRRIAFAIEKIADEIPLGRARELWGDVVETTLRGIVTKIRTAGIV